MPWRDINGSSYYYQSYRQGGKVRNRFVGNGPIADLVEAADAYIRAKRRQQRQDEQAKLEDLRKSEAELGLAEFVAAVEVVFRAIMAAAGFHKHARGKWRRRRMPEVAISDAPAQSGRAKAKPPIHHKYGIYTEEDFKRIVPDGREIGVIFRKAASGDASVVETLQMLLDLDEEGLLAKFEGVDSGARLQALLVSKASGNDLALRESLRIETDRIRESMAGEDPTPSERLLADRVAITWLDLRRVELIFAEREHEMNAKIREEFQRRIARGNRAHVEAIKALAVVRKLAIPVLQMQMNIGDSGHQKMIAKAGNATPCNRGESR